MTNEESNDNSTHDEGQSIETLNAKLTELTKALESEKGSKERILNESKEYKEKFQTYRAKEEEANALRVQEEEEKLRKQGQFQTLLEQRELRIKELEGSLVNAKSEVEESDRAILNLRKASAFEKAIGGKLKRDAYWNHVDFEAIAINPETQSIDADSLNTVASDFVKEYKELVSFANNANLPNGAPNGSGTGKITYKQWQALPLAERKKRMSDVIN